jgi:hypothetical protein
VRRRERQGLDRFSEIAPGDDATSASPLKESAKCQQQTSDIRSDSGYLASEKSRAGQLRLRRSRKPRTPFGG